MVINTLELGGSRSGCFHCMLVCVYAFTKWVEVVPLRRHDTRSVADGFLSVCARCGPPATARCDNGSEFVIAIMSALFKSFGVRVQHGAVRHPQRQGAVERFNRTLLTLIRKTLQQEDDWEAALDLLLFRYRIRPHSVTKTSPAEAMHGWKPKSLLVEEQMPEFSESAWVDRLKSQVARVWDFVDGQLSKADFIDDPSVICPYPEGTAVLLRKPDRCQKRQSPYESGWHVEKVIAHSSVQIVSVSGARKIVNIDLLKADPGPLEQDVPEENDPTAKSDDDLEDIPLVFTAEEVCDNEPVQTADRLLRNRAALQIPSRYRD